MPRTPNIPSATYGDARSVGQLARQWAKSHDFVRRLITEGKLTTDASDRVSNESLRDFYANHGTDLDA